MIVTTNATSHKTHYPVTDLVERYKYAKFHQDKAASGVNEKHTRSNLGTYYTYQEGDSPTIIFLITNYTPGSSAEYNSITKRRIELCSDDEEKARLGNDTSENRQQILKDTLDYLTNEQGRNITDLMDRVFFWGWEGPRCLPGGRIYETVSNFSKAFDCKFSMIVNKRNGETNVVIEGDLTPPVSPQAAADDPSNKTVNVKEKKKSKRKREAEDSEAVKKQKEKDDMIRDFLNSDEWTFNSQIFE